MPELEVKVLGPLTIKSEESGEVEAVIATLNVVDKDADVIAETAIKAGAKVKLSSYGHDAVFGDMPVGKGTLHVEDGKVVFKGRYFRATQRGREAFETIKELGADQEWSFGFRVLKAEDPDDDWRAKGARRVLTKLDAFEVSPVIMGAGVGTQTVAVKEAEEVRRAAADLEEKAAALVAINRDGAAIFARGRRFLGAK